MCLHASDFPDPLSPLQRQRQEQVDSHIFCKCIIVSHVVIFFSFNVSILQSFMLMRCLHTSCTVLYSMVNGVFFTLLFTMGN